MLIRGVNILDFFQSATFARIYGAEYHCGHVTGLKNRARSQSRALSPNILTIEMIVGVYCCFQS